MHIDLIEAFRARYKMRRTGYARKFNVVVTIPPPVLQKEAERRGLTPEQLVERCEAVVHFGSFPGIYITIEEPGASNKGVRAPTEKKGGDEWWFPSKD